jgi:hypothetical protein
LNKSDDSSDVEFEDVSKIKAQVLAHFGQSQQPRQPIIKYHCTRKKVVINLHSNIFKRTGSELQVLCGVNW